MTTETTLRKMKLAESVSSSVSKQCPFCREFTLDGITHFIESARHLQDKHALECMHVGQETSNDDQGKPWHSSVAFFGSENPPEELPLPSLNIEYFDKKRE